LPRTQGILLLAEQLSASQEELHGIGINIIIDIASCFLIELGNLSVNNTVL
jgi:hypothetical protein